MTATFVQNQSATLLAPDSALSAPRTTQRLANTGTTESTNATALTNNAFATIRVGATPIRIVWRGSTGTGSNVATTDLILGSYVSVDWLVEAGTDFVAIEAADGSSAYEAHVYTSSY